MVKKSQKNKKIQFEAEKFKVQDKINNQLFFDSVFKIFFLFYFYLELNN